MYRYCKRLFLLFFLFPAVASAAADLDALRGLITGGKYEQAAQMAQAEIKTGNRDTALRFYYAYAVAQLGQTDKAIDEFRRLATELPKAPEPRNNLAALYAQQGKFDEARRELEAALATHQSYSTAHRNLGEIYSAMAVEAYNRALARDEKRAPPAPRLSLLNSMEMPSAAQIAAAPATTPAPPAKAEPVVAAAPPKPVSKPAAVAAKVNTPPAPAPKAEPAAPATPVAISKPEPAKPAQVPPPAAPPAAEKKIEIPKAVAATAPAPVPPPPPPTASAAPSAQAESVVLASAETPAVRAPDLEQQARDVTASVQAWARAWAAQNPDAYLDAYAAGFQPEGGVPRAEWSKLRRERLINPKRVVVNVVDMQVKLLDDNSAQARFLQHYASDIMEDTVEKRLDLVNEGGEWKIQREQVGQRQY